MLTTDTETPEMTHTSVGMDFLQAFQIFTQFWVQVGGGQLGEFSIDAILLSVQEPGWDLVLEWVQDDGDNFFNLESSEI